MSDEISRRNTEGVMHTLRRMEITVTEQEVRLKQFNELVSTLIQRITVLEEAETVRRIKAMGQGPTVNNGKA